MSRRGSWATGRQISPGTLNAISLLLAICAAIWFSGGSADRGPGLLALASSVLAMAGAGWLAEFAATGVAVTGTVRPGPARRERASADYSTDWLALPDVPWAGERSRVAAPAGGHHAAGGDSAAGGQSGAGGAGDHRETSRVGGPSPAGGPSAAGRDRPDDEDDVVVVVSRESSGPELRAISTDRAAPAAWPGVAADPPRARQAGSAARLPGNQPRPGAAAQADAAWAAGAGGHWVDIKPARRGGQAAAKRPARTGQSRNRPLTGAQRPATRRRPATRGPGRRGRAVWRPTGRWLAGRWLAGRRRMALRLAGRWLAVWRPAGRRRMALRLAGRWLAVWRPAGRWPAG